jgi:hypothetical protein
MTPKEKAQDLYNKMDNQRQISSDAAKQCALIAVEEILNVTSESYDIDHINWWKKVKQEIEAL